MKIAIYGLPCAGKTHILKRVEGLEALEGSSLLKGITPDFHERTPAEKEIARKQLAKRLEARDGFIMDGHYAFGSNVVFTEEDKALYDAFLYLRIDPEIIRQRMTASEKNGGYAALDIGRWQEFEIKELRGHCHEANKDFYVLDNPSSGSFEDVTLVLDFISEINRGFSCVGFAKSIAEDICRHSPDGEINLVDGDGTLTPDDTASVAYGYRTDVFDGNYYTGYQSWLHQRALERTIAAKKSGHADSYVPPIAWFAQNLDPKSTFILTSGPKRIWKSVAESLSFSLFSGPEMSADTKYFVSKFLQTSGRRVLAYGDSMNDYHMLKGASVGFLVERPDGTISRSLRDTDLKGLSRVRHE